MICLIILGHVVQFTPELHYEVVYIHIRHETDTEVVKSCPLLLPTSRVLSVPWFFDLDQMAE